MQLLPIHADGSTAADVRSAGESGVETLAQTLALYGRQGFHPPWIGYLAMEDGRCVGACGFAGPPRDGEVEIAYFTFPEHEGKGVASRMAAGLIALTRAAALGSGVRFIAHTLPEENPSTRILKRLGFERVGEIQHPEDGLIWKWREPGLPAVVCGIGMGTQTPPDKRKT